MNPKLTRGRILACCAAAYPTPTTDITIRLQLDDLAVGEGEEQLGGMLCYLRDEEYVRLEQDYSEVQGEFTRIWLTGKGLALVRGDLPVDSWIDPRGYEAVGRMDHIRKKG